VLKPEHAHKRMVLRRLRDHDGEGGRFAEAARSWVMIDLEPAAAPPWIDPTDPMLVGGYLRRQLPKSFQFARCVVQLSSGAGIKPGSCALQFGETSPCA
jgi:hypothetical protein